MRIAFLCKRRYMSKDVIIDRYARLYEIPFQLARLGHDVRGYCLSYQNAEEGTWTHDAAPGKLTWESHSPGRLYLAGLINYRRRLLQRLHGLAPDMLIGASDIPHVALAAWLSKRLRVPYVIDLYDNFEGFGQARIPGMVAMLRKAVRGAGLVTTTSEPLRELVVDVYKTRGEVLAMPSTVDKRVFHPRDKLACRMALGLPTHAILMGTAGGLLGNRGIDTVYAAWRTLAARHSDIHLVLAGPTDKHCPPPSDSRVHYLGLLPHASTAELFSALDVGVIYLRDTPFGKYCFPQKAHEMMACHVPVVATALGVMPSLLIDTPEYLYRTDDPEDLVRALEMRLSRHGLSHRSIPDWAELIGGIEPYIRALAAIGGEGTSRDFTN